MKVFLNELVNFTRVWIPDDAEQAKANFERLERILECFNFHLEAQVYYSGAGLANLFHNMQELFSERELPLTNRFHRIRVLLNEIEAIDWDNVKRQKVDHAYYFQSGGGSNPISVKDSSLAEAAEYKLNNEEAVTLNFMASNFNETNPIFVARSSNSPPPSILIAELRVLISKQDTVGYVVEKRAARTYNWNKKHGENGVGMIPNKGEIVSPLECSRVEAADLLPSAVAYRKGRGDLYAFDAARNKFMVFRSDNTPDNGYHSFHPINQSEVNDAVKKFLRS